MKWKNVILVTITFNAILAGKLYNTTTYSLWYGGSYSGSTERKKTPLETTFLIHSKEDLDQLPTSLSNEAVIALLQNTFTDSSIRLEEIVNLVYIFR